MQPLAIGQVQHSSKADEWKVAAALQEALGVQHSPATIRAFLQDWLLEVLDCYLIDLLLPLAETLLLIL